MTIKRAWSTLEIKAVDGADGKRTFTGIATTPSTDRMDDVVVPEGAKFKLPIALLWQHDSRQPIGWVTAARVTPKGIEVDGEIAVIDEPGNLQDRINDAWQMLKAKLVRGLSIGFNALETSRIEGTWGLKYLSWEWLELSAVTIPANGDCSITAIKSIDEQQRAALGLTQRSRVVRIGAPLPGVSGTQTKPAARGLSSVPTKGNTVKTNAEMIAEWKAKKAVTVAKLAEMMGKADQETLNKEEGEEVDALMQEVKDIDAHIARSEAVQKMLGSTATEVDTTPVTRSVQGGVEVRGGSVLSVKRNLPKGTAFVRYAQALAQSKGQLDTALAFAKRSWNDSPEVAQVLEMAKNFGSTAFNSDEVQKAAVNVGTSSDATWASPLVFYNNMASEFIDILRPMTIIGKMDGLRKMPFNVRVASKTSGSTAGWVGENSPKPVSALGFNAVTLGHAKAAGIVVITQELARFSSPAAESLVAEDLRATIIQFLDQQFIDPAVAAVANVSPASITNGITAIPSTGTTLAAITTDVQSLFSAMLSAELDPTNAVWVMTPGTALNLMLKRTSQDIFTFPDIKMNGGTWFGLPVITSNSVPHSVSGGSIIALVIQSEIFLADDGNITLDVSQEASVQMSSTPSAGATSLVSLWQNNLLGLRAEREINWQRRRDTAVGYIDGFGH